MTQIQVDSECNVIGEILVGGKYRLNSYIKSGTWGTVYSGYRVTNGEKVAVKLERVDPEYQLLFNEVQVYKATRGGVHFPCLRWYGMGKDFNVLVLDLLGPDLWHLEQNICSGRFSVKTVLMLADQMISALEYLHDMNYVHRDIKEYNFTVGIGANVRKVYLIDFGIAKMYRDSITGVHIPYSDDVGSFGALVYMSMNSLLGAEQSRRDDMESLGYVLVHFVDNLPWYEHEVVCKDREERHAKIKASRLVTPLKVVCGGCPVEFLDYLRYCRALGFEDTPDYEYLRGLFRNRFQALGYTFDYEFDWCCVDKGESGTLEGGGDHFAGTTRGSGELGDGVLVPEWLYKMRIGTTVCDFRVQREECREEVGEARDYDEEEVEDSEVEGQEEEEEKESDVAVQEEEEESDDAVQEEEEDSDVAVHEEDEEESDVAVHEDEEEESDVAVQEEEEEESDDTVHEEDEEDSDDAVQEEEDDSDDSDDGLTTNLIFHIIELQLNNSTSNVTILHIIRRNSEDASEIPSEDET